MKRPLRLRDLMRPLSRFKYLAWRAASFGAAITVRLKSGERLILRCSPATDISVAYEVFVMEIYRSPTVLDPATVRRIVDLGANVGYSVVYLARRYPEAHIDAFEPNPSELEVLAHHLEINGIRERVTLHPVAAGNASGHALLSADTGRSQITPGNGEQTIPVEVADFFAAVQKGRIDFLKMDIEGGEYPILMDDRFAALDLGAMTFEWHSSADLPDADTVYRSRLDALGWHVTDGVRDEYRGWPQGIMYAYHDG
jgi:FkbM family methyltransferase